MKNCVVLLIVMMSLYGCAIQKVASDKEIDLHCQRLNVLHQKIEAITSNIANIKTTRTPAGGPYKRKIIAECRQGLCKEILDSRTAIMKYEPGHPDANKSGYVAYPNIILEEEQGHLKEWEFVFENIVKYGPVTSEFFLKDPKAKLCFEKYKYVENRYNFKNYFEN